MTVLDKKLWTFLKIQNSDTPRVRAPVLVHRPCHSSQTTHLPTRRVFPARSLITIPSPLRTHLLSVHHYRAHHHPVACRKSSIACFQLLLLPITSSIAVASSPSRLHNHCPPAVPSLKSLMPPHPATPRRTTTLDEFFAAPSATLSRPTSAVGGICRTMAGSVSGSCTTSTRMWPGTRSLLSCSSIMLTPRSQPRYVPRTWRPLTSQQG